MKGIVKKLGLLGLTVLTGVSLASCNKTPGDDPVNPQPPVVDPDNPQPPVVEKEKANGAFSYIAANYDERTEILSTLEKYAVENNLTGITLFEDSGYVMYEKGVERGATNYIPGYGFGVVTEGRITSDLKGEQNPAWKRYYHDLEPSVPGTINYMNDTGSVVSDLVSYLSAPYWTTRMNETKDGYEWAPVLAVDERPEAVNPGSNGLATKYKFEVRTDVKYSTQSSKYGKYNGRAIKAEDYLTPYQMLYTQAFAMARGAEQLEGPGSIKGMAKYYNDSKNGFNQKSWEDNVGLKLSNENGKTYLTVEFNIPTSRFYAMYYLASPLYSPVPREFIEELGNGDFAAGMKVYGNKTETGLTQVDTFLATGPYSIESWTEQALVFKKNTSYTIEGPNRYRIDGLHFKIAKNITTDQEHNFNEFQAGNVHATNIPSTKLAEWKNNPAVLKTVGATTTKLNLNATDEATWEQLFGENGSVTQTNKADYWKVEPAMSNKDFTKALSFAINRKEFADNVGRTPSIDYFGRSYLSDPENGIIYNSTEEHKNAVKSLTEGSDGYGYNFEKAKALFKKATDDLIAAGKYKAGDTITLDCVWQAQSNVTVYGSKIYTYWQKAFEASGSKLKLECKSIIPADWQDAYNKHMKKGQFDIGFGGINGNPLNPLNFLEVLKSDNSSGYTLNWGTDTSKVSNDIVYDNKTWSFDALWTASEQGAYVQDGELQVSHDAQIVKDSITKNADGTVTFTANLNVKNNVENLYIQFDKAVIFAYFSEKGVKDPVYKEDQVTFKLSEDKQSVVVTISKDLVTKYTADNLINGTLAVDFYFNVTISGVTVGQIDTLPFAFPIK